MPVTLPNGMQQEADLSYIENYPKDAQLIAYGYTPDTYEKWDMIINQGKFVGRDPVFAGGIWNWLSFAPNWFFSFNSAIPQLRACKANGIKDVFATTWGDEGAECPIDVTLLGMQLWAELGYAEDYDEKTKAFNIYRCTFPGLDYIAVSSSKSYCIASLSLQ